MPNDPEYPPFLRIFFYLIHYKKFLYTEVIPCDTVIHTHIVCKMNNYYSLEYQLSFHIL